MRKGLISKFNEIQECFNEELKSIIPFGGGIKCDGVKLESNKRKYYDFVMEFLKLTRKSIAMGRGVERKICKRLIFVINIEGPETAECIRDNLNSQL